jgi:hypothetical protein
MKPGRKPKDPVIGARVSATFRIHPFTKKRLLRHASQEQSQGEIIDEAVEKWVSGKPRNRPS